MVKALRVEVLSALMVTLFAITATAGGQTKDSPLRLYQGPGNGPVPKKIKTVTPRYPKGAQTGSMVLEVTLRPDGTVEAVTPIRRLRGATDAAIAAVKQWRYEPVVFRGKPAWAILDILIWNPWRSLPSPTPGFLIPTRLSMTCRPSGERFRSAELCSSMALMR